VPEATGPEFHQLNHSRIAFPNTKLSKILSGSRLLPACESRPNNPQRYFAGLNHQPGPDFAGLNHQLELDFAGLNHQPGPGSSCRFSTFFELA